MNTDKLAINWQNFAQVRLKLEFAFIYGPKPSMLFKWITRPKQELNCSEDDIVIHISSTN